jgi:ABC-type sugar transport system ATPase subunit
MPEETLALEASGITKSYPGVRALKGVDITLRRGRVTALVGENGAGKSTFIRVMAGLEQADAGTLRIGGTEHSFQSAHDSEAAGISVVSQEFRLVPQLSVADNISLGHEIRRFGLVDRRATKARARDILAALGLEIDPEQRVDSLTIGDQQLLEIARALSRDFDILVMDEPSAALNVSEVTRLLALVRRLRDAGKAILYVSHRLDEIFAVTDDITVFRDGRKVAELVTAETDERTLVGHMLGRELEQAFARSAVPVHPDARAKLEITALDCPKLREPFGLRVSAGEIVGIAGLVGSGRAEVMRTLFGALPARSGEIRIDGRATRIGSPTQAMGAGLFMLGEDRKAEGIFPHLSVLENLLTPPASKPKGGGRSWVPLRSRETRTYADLRERLRIRVDSPRQLIGNLSGGNQQKVLFGRAVLSGCEVLLLNEPTRGVDVGAKVEIYELVGELARSGVAVIVSSSEAAELASLVDRCVVLYAGAVTAVLDGARVTEPNIVSASVGQAREEAA